MTLRFPILDDDKAYLGCWLYLPKQHIAEHVLRSSLTLPIDQTQTLVCYQDHPNHLAVPRALIPLDEVRAQLPLIDLRPRSSEHSFQSDILLDAVRPDRSVQHESVEALLRSDGGILNLSCGKGKTIIALELAARLQQKTLVVVKGDGVLEQWRDQINARLRLKTPVGLIQGPVKKWDWEGRAITLASIDTLARHHAKVPAAMRRSFGVIIFDETHILGARTFSRAASLFHGRRFGLTATVHREDDMESVFLWHLGPVIYSDLTQDLIPTVTLLPSPTAFDWENTYNIRVQVTDCIGELSPSRLTNYTANRPEELSFIEYHIRQAVEAGRNILAISLSKDQLIELNKRFPESGLITGSVKGKARQDALANHKLTFGIASLTREALDKKELDTLFILTEFKAEGMLQQAVGRIQRWLEGQDKSCRVVIVQHKHIAGVSHRAYHMVRYFRRQGFEVEEAPRRGHD